MFVTAAAGEKSTLTSPFVPKNMNLIRKGTITDRKCTVRPERGG